MNLPNWNNLYVVARPYDDNKIETTLILTLLTFVSLADLWLSTFLFLLFSTDRGLGPPGRLRLRRGFISTSPLNFSSVSLSCVAGSRREIWTLKESKAISLNKCLLFFPSYCGKKRILPVPGSQMVENEFLQLFARSRSLAPARFSSALRPFPFAHRHSVFFGSSPVLIPSPRLEFPRLFARSRSLAHARFSSALR